MNFRKNILLYTIIPLLVLFIAASYFRFVISHDYMVAYEGQCNEFTQNCFVGCEDETCSEEYYFSKIEKYASTLLSQCGSDITDCEQANFCTSEEKNSCSVTYCDPESDNSDCESYSINDSTLDEEGSESSFIELNNT